MAVVGTTSLGSSHVVLLLLGGLGAGVFNGVAGGGSLISFPLLLALGYPALTANITNTVGIWPGYVGGAAGFRKEISGQRERLVSLGAVAALGGIAGALLLLTTSSAAFRSIVPWLVLGASILFAVQPLLKRALGGTAHTPPRTRPILLAGGTFAASVYGGYFGAGLGVMLLAILGLALPDSIVRTSGLRTALSILVNGVAAVVFLIHGGLAWEAVGLLAAGSLVGGWVGARVALSIPPWALRAVVVAIGLATAVKLLA
ncbi:MAG: sulfite exporter TauE/SafE family protein [Acidimicrobiales bacterium]